jgi:hypothetical protein
MSKLITHFILNDILPINEGEASPQHCGLVKDIAFLVTRNWDQVTCEACLVRRPDQIDILRQNDNAELLTILTQYLVDNPGIRFGQALRNLGIIRELRGKVTPEWVNEFYTEPSEMIKRAKDALRSGA